MKHPAVLDRRRAALAVIDLQEAFRPMIAGFGELAQRIAVTVQACRVLDVPIIVTEQYPKGLGRTVAEVAEHLPAGTVPLEKQTFSACGVQEFDVQLREHHAEQVIVCGIEAHICVSQTAHDLLQLGYQVHLLCDAVAARLPHNREVAIQKLIGNGAIISSIEMALFELCGGADTPEFKQVQQLVKGLQ
ncbi:MAG: isochorismatase family protein [Acidobacteria bacterium]|nr:isochorismatase family protein [Acidobacteriota bacterium]MBI3421996.1 isochorismatase family protein [Acidobacteriota bacterium]